MLAEERRNRLLDLIRQRRFITLPDLAEQLEVSESTVRRDLELIEEQGKAKRTHGGVFYTGSTPRIPHFDTLNRGNWDEKRAIARRAVERVEDGDSVLIEGGSSTYEVARLLVGRPLHVVTSSLPIANLFATDTNCDLIFIGGDICPRTGVSRGPLAGRMLESLRVRIAVMSAAGANEEGFFNNSTLLVETEQAMMRAADEVIVVADSTKWGRSSLTHLCRLSDVQCIVVDSGLPEPWRQTIRDSGAELWIAEL